MTRKTGEERREEVLETALTLIHEEGQEGLTIGNIADRIDVTEPAIYRHFDSKEEIVEALAQDVFQKERLTVDEDDITCPGDVVSSVLEGLFRGLEEDPRVTSIIFQPELFRQYPGVQELFSRHRKEKKQKLAGIIEKGQEEQVISEGVDPETFAMVLMGAARVTVLEWRNDDFSYPLVDKAEQVSRELVKILEA